MTKAMQGYGFDDRSIMRYWKNIDPKVIAQINFDIKTKMSEKKIKNTKAYARTCYENAFDIAIAQKMGEEVKQFA